MSIDYKQLQALVKEAMFTGGGINEPSAPGGVPHRMPAAEPRDKEQDMGEEEPNEKYDIALAAREATEQLVEALDKPIYDGAYEHAFKASACLRKALNSLVEAGAHPMPIQRVVAPDPGEQMYSAGGSNAGNYTGGMGGFAMSMGDGAGGMMEATGEAPKAKSSLQALGVGQQSAVDRMKAMTAQNRDIVNAGEKSGIDRSEHKLLGQVLDFLTKTAKEDNLLAYKSALQTFLTNLEKASDAKVDAKKRTT